MRNYLLTITLLLIFGLSPLSCMAQNKRALLVGVSDYGNPQEDPDRWMNISGANDVALLKPMFVKQGFRVQTLVNAQATHRNIVNSLKNLGRQCRKGNLVYIHFSMHGQPFEDLNGDEKDGWDEALIPVDAQMRYVKGKYEGKNHLIDDELEVYVNNIRAKLGTTGMLYVVLDACHSGTSSRGDEDAPVRGVNEGFTRSGKFYTPDRAHDTNDYFKVPSKKGDSPVVFVEACRSYQQNKEIREAATNKWYGPLSYYITKAMATYKIDKSNNWINAVKNSMASDRRVRRQNVVIESSK